MAEPCAAIPPARRHSTVLDLTFAVESAGPLSAGAAPHFAFRVRVVETASVLIHTAVLRCQVRLEGCRGLSVTPITVVVPPFRQVAFVDVPVLCSFDLMVAAAKGLEGKTRALPVRLQFSGIVYYEDASGTLQMAPLSPRAEAFYSLSAAQWSTVLDRHFPHTAWMTLGRGRANSGSR